MKKKISISVDEEIWDYLDRNYVNKSKLVEASIRQFIEINTDFGRFPKPKA